MTERQRPAGSINLTNATDFEAKFNNWFHSIRQECLDELSSQGFSDSQISTERFLRLRYDGTDFPLMISEKEINNGVGNAQDWVSVFRERFAFLKLKMDVALRRFALNPFIM